MKRCVFLPLSLNVFSYLCLITVLAHRTREIPVRPKLPAPQPRLYPRASPKYLSRRDAFDHLDNFLHGIHRYGLNQKVHVILIRTYLEKLDLVTCLYVQADIPENLIHIRINNSSAVLRRENEMIQQDRDVMALVDIAAHDPS